MAPLRPVHRDAIADIVRRDGLAAKWADRWRAVVVEEDVVGYLALLAPAGAAPAPGWVREQGDGYVARSLGRVLAQAVPVSDLPAPVAAELLALAWARRPLAAGHPAPHPRDDPERARGCRAVVARSCAAAHLRVHALRPRKEGNEAIVAAVARAWIIDHGDPPDSAADRAWLTRRAEKVVAARARLRPQVVAAVEPAAPGAGRRRRADLVAASLDRLVRSGSAPSSPRAVERVVTLAIDLERAVERDAVRAASRADGSPHLSAHEIAGHLARVRGVAGRLADTDWLAARVAALADWANDRVRSAIRRDDVVARACRKARASDADHVHYNLLRLTQKRDRERHYGIVLEDPAMSQALAGHAAGIARNVARRGAYVAAIHRRDRRALEQLARSLGARRVPAGGPVPPAVAAVNEAFERVVEIIGNGPAPGAADETLARTSPALDDAEHIFDSDVMHWIGSVRRTMLKRARGGCAAPDGEQLPGTGEDPDRRDGGDEPWDRPQPNADERIEAGDGRLAELRSRQEDHDRIPCSHPPTAARCAGGCLHRRLARQRRELPGHGEALAATLAHRPDDDAALPAALERTSARLERNAAFAELEQRRLPDLLDRVTQANGSKTAQVARLSLHTEHTRACARNRLAALAPDLYPAGLAVFDDAGIRAASGAASEHGVRQLRYLFLARLKRDDEELAHLFQWLRSDPERDEFEWLPVTVGAGRDA